MPVKAMVPKREPAVAEAATVENMSGAKSAAMEHGATAVETAAMEATAATVKSATTVASSTAMAATTATATAATMAAADFGRQPVGGVCRCRRRARTDRR